MIDTTGRTLISAVAANASCGDLILIDDDVLVEITDSVATDWTTQTFVLVYRECESGAVRDWRVSFTRILTFVI